MKTIKLITTLGAAAVWFFALILLYLISYLFVQSTFFIVSSLALLTSKTIASYSESYFLPLAPLTFLMLDLKTSHLCLAMSLSRYSFTAHLLNQIYCCFSFFFCNLASLLCFFMLPLFIIFLNCCSVMKTKNKNNFFINDFLLNNGRRNGASFMRII